MFLVPYEERALTFTSQELLTAGCLALTKPAAHILLMIRSEFIPFLAGAKTTTLLSSNKSYSHNLKMEVQYIGYVKTPVTYQTKTRQAALQKYKA